MKSALSVFFTLLTIAAFSQRRGTGLAIDRASYMAVPQMVQYNGSKADILPWKVDLSIYCPKPGNQGRIGSCVGWASAYGVLSIMEAQRDNLTDTEAISKRARSAMFVYNQTKIGGCEHGTFIPRVSDFLKENGDIEAVEFDTPVEDCSRMPSQEQKDKGKKHRIKEYSLLFIPDTDPKTKIMVTKQSLAADKPVLIGMNVTEGFMDAKGVSVWDPAVKPAEMGAHAMCVVGFSEAKGAFQLFNSWGKEWGENGLIWVKYEDYTKFCIYGFQFFLADKQDESGQVEPKKVELSGTFNLKTPVWDDKENMSFQKVNVRRDGDVYTVTDAWEVGKYFQIAAAGMKKDKYVYVFSIDPKDKGEIHFPAPKEGEQKEITFGASVGPIKKKNTDIIPDDDAEVIIPEPKPLPGGKFEPQALYTALAGSDHIVILFSDRQMELQELGKRIQKCLANPKMPFIERFKAGFEDITVPAADVKYDPDTMNFTSFSKPGLAVPLILRVDSK